MGQRDHRPAPISDDPSETTAWGNGRQCGNAAGLFGNARWSEGHTSVGVPQVLSGREIVDTRSPWCKHAPDLPPATYSVRNSFSLLGLPALGR